VPFRLPNIIHVTSSQQPQYLYPQSAIVQALASITKGGEITKHARVTGLGHLSAIRIYHLSWNRDGHQKKMTHWSFFSDV